MKAEDVMHKIGFKGYGDFTGPIKSFLLALVLGGLSILSVWMMMKDGLLMGVPAIYYNFNVWGFLIVAVIIAFFAVFWRHIPIIILMSVFSAVSIFCLVYIATNPSTSTYFPPSVVKHLQPSEDVVKQIKALENERFALYKRDYASDDLPYGALVTVTHDADKKIVVRYQGSEKTGVSRLKYLRIDRTYKVKKTSSLLASPSPNAAAVGEIRKGQRVTLTGASSGETQEGKNPLYGQSIMLAGGAVGGSGMVEVIYNGEKGWIDEVNVIPQLLTGKSVRFHAMTPLRALVLLGIYVLWYLFHLVRVLYEYIDYYKRNRKKFPWLENWIQENGNPAVMRALSGAIKRFFWFALPFFGFSFVVSFLVNALCHLIVFNYYSSVPANIELPLLYLGTVVGPIVAGIITQIIWNTMDDRSPRRLENLPYHLRALEPLECYHCGCPHSVVMFHIRNEVTGQTTTVTTETTKYTDGTSKTRKSSHDTYEGITFADLRCLNCNKEKRETLEGVWGGYAPNSDTTYDPPLTGYGSEETRRWKKRWLVIALVIVGIMALNELFGGVLFGSIFNRAPRATVLVISAEEQEIFDQRSADVLNDILPGSDSATVSNVKQVVKDAKKNAISMYEIGYYYATGEKLSKDTEKARYWLQLAADKGDDTVSDAAKAALKTLK